MCMLSLGPRDGAVQANERVQTGPGVAKRRAAAAEPRALPAKVAASGLSWMAVSATSTVPAWREMMMETPKATRPGTGSIAMLMPSSAAE